MIDLILKIYSFKLGLINHY